MIDAVLLSVLVVAYLFVVGSRVSNVVIWLRESLASTSRRTRLTLRTGRLRVRSTMVHEPALR